MAGYIGKSQGKILTSVESSSVEAAGALMDSEVTNLTQVKAFSSADYATAAQGTKADAAASTGKAIAMAIVFGG